ncbi:MAG TPA: EamA family transporter [Terriglobales bacterium]|nr:EamA family transporter [Terriglobales bacterium]
MKTAYTWATITAVVLASTAGDVLLAYAMQRVGDLGEVRVREGIFGAIRRVITNGWFMFGLFFMALAFFSLLVALSWADVSLVAPASASITFVTNAIAARIFLKENVDRRRWMSAMFVAAGVLLLAH